jgi:YVTN family beta-propeller protein
MRCLTLSVLLTIAAPALAAEQHLLYAASPGIRNYVEYGGVGIVVFDMDHDYRFVRRIPTWDVPAGAEAENVKGIAANAKTGIVYVSTIKRLAAFDAVSGKRLWDIAPEGGCDRMALSPDGKVLYVPSFEGPHWTVVEARTGKILAKIQTGSGSHNTIYAPDGSRVYLASLRTNLLAIADPKTNTVTATVGPFAAPIRPFTVNGSNTLCYVNVNGLLGFEVGDIRTGRKLARVELPGVKDGPVKRHGCPSHGIALSPDEKELWVSDGPNDYIHVFDAAPIPPVEKTKIKVRDLPGWITFSIDGRHVFSSTGEVIDARTKQIVATLRDEAGHEFQSEKAVELDLDGGKVVRAGDQFGIGSKR